MKRVLNCVSRAVLAAVVAFGIVFSPVPLGVSAQEPDGAVTQEEQQNGGVTETYENGEYVVTITGDALDALDIQDDYVEPLTFPAEVDAALKAYDEKYAGDPEGLEANVGELNAATQPYGYGFFIEAITKEEMAAMTTVEYVRCNDESEIVFAGAAAHEHSWQATSASYKHSWLGMYGLCQQVREEMTRVCVYPNCGATSVTTSYFGGCGQYHGQ